MNWIFLCGFAALGDKTVIKHICMYFFHKEVSILEKRYYYTLNVCKTQTAKQHHAWCQHPNMTDVFRQ